tara:strand:- start:279 stop:557 length:279 start_codon:yes stop_codon:yes gene_type:complete
METAISWKACKSLIAIKKEINMGFNKRYVSSGKLWECFNRDGLDGVLRFLGKADAFICEDDFSSEIVKEFQSTKPPSKILEILESRFIINKY